MGFIKLGRIMFGRITGSSDSERVTKATEPAFGVLAAGGAGGLSYLTPQTVSHSENVSTSSASRQVARMPRIIQQERDRECNTARAHCEYATKLERNVSMQQS